MKTLVEFFDTNQIENVNALLRYKPDKVVFVGFKNVMSKSRKRAIDKFLSIRLGDDRPEIEYAIAGTGMRQATARGKELLELLGLEDRADHKPSELSGGEKQRIAVARALANQPDVILADEPSGSLDTKNKEELHNLFFNLRDQLGQTFVIVTHDESLAAMTDRTIHLLDGAIRP